MYKKLEKEIIKIAKQAAEIARNCKFEIKEKGDITNIVTTGDINVQHFLQEKLKELLPNSGFLCEEEDLKDLNHDYLWIIDPIDGTTNYSRNIKECSISIALSYKTKIVIGVVYNIYQNDIFHATLNNGAYLNNKRINVSNNEFNNAILCTAMSTYKKDYAKVCSDIIYEAFMQINDFRRFGSCALELCYLAAGKCDLYFEIRLSPWDYAAAHLILNEAGGILTGFNKEELKYDKLTFLIGANNDKNHDKLNNIILNHLKEVPYES